MEQHMGGYESMTWMPVIGYEGLYEVSDQGVVRSLDRRVPCGRHPGGTRLAKGCVLAVQITHRGYRRINLSNGTVAHKFVHQLVAEAFIGPKPSGMQICHNDGDKNNNTAANLRYDTASANVKDSIRHGTQAQARKTHCPQGHSFTEDNITWVTTPSGRGRHCKTCKREREQKRRALRKSA